MTPRETLDAWLRCFNAGDSDAIAALYAEDAVNFQVALGEPVVGRAAIRQMHRELFASGALQCIPVNIVADDSWAALEWTDPEGFRGSGFFQIADGLIVTQRGYWDRLGLQQRHPGVH